MMTDKWSLKICSRISRLHHSISRVPSFFHRLLGRLDLLRREKDQRSCSLSQPAFQSDRTEARFNPSQRFGQAHSTSTARGLGAEERIERTLHRGLVHS